MPIDQQMYRELVAEIAAQQARLSSSTWFLDGNEQLRLRTFGSLAAVVVAVEGRMLDVRGNVVPFAFTHTPQSDRTVASTFHRLGEGFLLGLALRASTGAPRRGQVYAILEVVRGQSTNATPSGVIWQGYVTDTTPAGWPAVPSYGSIEGPGVLRSIAGTDPAAGVEITETVPTNARWRVRGVSATLVTDATVATRRVQVTLDDGTTTFWTAQATAGQDASLTRNYNFPNYGSYVVAQTTAIGVPGPDVIDLMGAHRLRTQTGNLQAGDNWGAPQLLIEEWIED